MGNSVIKRRNLLKGTALVAGSAVAQTIQAESSQFLLFAGDCYYPLGGPKDFQGRFSSIDDAIQVFIDRLDRGEIEAGRKAWAMISDSDLNLIKTVLVRRDQ